MATITEQIKELRQAWEVIFPHVKTPEDRQFGLWLMSFDLDLVRSSLAKLALRYERSPSDFAAPENLYRFATSIMRRVATHRRERQQ